MKERRKLLHVGVIDLVIYLAEKLLLTQGEILSKRNLRVWPRILSDCLEGEGFFFCFQEEGIVMGVMKGGVRDKTTFEPSTIRCTDTTPSLPEERGRNCECYAREQKSKGLFLNPNNHVLNVPLAHWSRNTSIFR